MMNKSITHAGLSQAENYYRKAINLDLRSKPAWRNLALLYVQKNQYSRAFQTLNSDDRLWKLIMIWDTLLCSMITWTKLNIFPKSH